MRMLWLVALSLNVHLVASLLSREIPTESMIERAVHGYALPTPKPGRTAFLFTGAPREFMHSRIQQLMQHNLFDALVPSGEYDVFCRVALKDASAALGYKPLTEDSLNLKQLKQDVPHLADMQTYMPGEQDEEMEQWFPDDLHRAAREVDPGRYSMWFNRMMVYQLAKRYERNMGSNYSNFVHVRFDSLVGYPLPPIEQFSEEAIHVPMMWSHHIPDIFAIIPGALAPKFYDFNAWFQEGVYCFGGQNGALIGMTTEQCQSKDELAKRNISKKLQKVIATRCCETNDDSFSENILYRKMQSLGLDAEFAKIFLSTTGMGFGNGFQPGNMDGFAEGERDTRASWAMHVGAWEAARYAQNLMPTANPPKLDLHQAVAQSTLVNSLKSPVPSRPDNMMHFLPAQLLVLDQNDAKPLDEKVYRWSDPKVSQSWNCLVGDSASDGATKKHTQKACLGYKESSHLKEDEYTDIAQRWMYFAEKVGQGNDNLFFLKTPTAPANVGLGDMSSKCLASLEDGTFESRACSVKDAAQHWTIGKGETNEQEEKRLQLGARWWDVSPSKPSADKNHRFVLVQHILFPCVDGKCGQ